MRLLSDLDIAKKKVGLRLDLNVPIKEGVVTDDTRILASLETLNYLIKAEAKIVILSHLGRPKEGTFDEQLSLRPVASHLSNELGISISLINSMKEFHDTNAQICMLENIRFFDGESKNSDSLAREIGSHIDVYVFDAFGTSHRKQACFLCEVPNASKTYTSICEPISLASESEFFDSPSKKRIFSNIQICAFVSWNSFIELIKEMEMPNSLLR